MPLPLTSQPMKTFTLASPHDLSAVAMDFLHEIGSSTVIAFYGNMGAGKTTFIKALCKALGVNDVVNSPTFSIVNEYLSAETGKRIYHFDFYRIKNVEEVYDMGFEDYFYSGAMCFIEWPELIEDLLPPDALRAKIEENADGTRTLTLE